MRTLSKTLLGLGLAALTSVASAQGVVFSCSAAQQPTFEVELDSYLSSLAVKQDWIEVSRGEGGVAYALSAERAQTTPVNMVFDPVFELKDDVIKLPTKKAGKTKTVLTVSRKEIVLALLHPGRRTEAPCSVALFKEHVELRQNIVVWTERLEWGWPNGAGARWNTAHWNRGTPKQKSAAATAAAVNDAFIQQNKYAIGCYTASKLAVLQGILDYYVRLNPNPSRLTEVVGCLWADNDPLINVEPAGMWFFEADFNKATLKQPGKVLRLKHDVAPEHFVPGDWAYMLNPDPVSYAKTGYEGSNAVYLGRSRFDDYYKDHNHAYTYLEKLDEVYQWRNSVFSRARDLDKVKPLSVGEVRDLGLPPEKGGLVLAYRAVPYFFGQAGYPQECQVPKKS